MSSNNFNLKFTYENVNETIITDFKNISRDDFDKDFKILEICLTNYGLAINNHSLSSSKKFYVNYAYDDQENCYYAFNYGANRIYKFESSGDIYYRDSEEIFLPTFLKQIDTPPNIIKLLVGLFNYDLNHKIN